MTQRPRFCFLLGTHTAADLQRSTAPLFISYHRLPRRRLRPACVPWGQDGRGYKQITTHGRYDLTPRQYALVTHRSATEIGGLVMAAIQDWMCEDEALRRTNLSVEEHQRRTIISFLELRSIAPWLPWMAVLQGRQLGDYLRHIEAYLRAGVDLSAERIVGVGSVCRRQSGAEGAAIIRGISTAAPRIQMHAFGFKTTGLRAVAGLLRSSDSLAWSFDARHGEPLPEHVGRHRNCANCLEYGLRWRLRLLADPKIAPHVAPHFIEPITAAYLRRFLRCGRELAGPEQLELVA